MGRTEKSFNKRLIGIIIGSTILGVTGLSMTAKGRGIIGRFLFKIKSAVYGIVDMAAKLGERLAKKEH